MIPQKYPYHYDALVKLDSIVIPKEMQHNDDRIIVKVRITLSMLYYKKHGYVKSPMSGYKKLINGKHVYLLYSGYIEYIAMKRLGVEICPFNYL